MGFFLTTDQSSHWYVVPANRAEEWLIWCQLPEENEAAWDAPEWAIRVNGAPELVRFKEFTIG